MECDLAILPPGTKGNLFPNSLAQKEQKEREGKRGVLGSHRPRTTARKVEASPAKKRVFYFYHNHTFSIQDASGEQIHLRVRLFRRGKLLHLTYEDWQRMESEYAALWMQQQPKPSWWRSLLSTFLSTAVDSFILQLIHLPAGEGEAPIPMIRLQVNGKGTWKSVRADEENPHPLPPGLLDELTEARTQEILERILWVVKTRIGCFAAD